MESFDVLIRFIGFLCTVLVAVLGTQVFRRKVDQQAEQRLAQIQIDTIAAQSETIQQLRIKSRVIEDIATNERHSREQCESALRSARQAIAGYDNLIGRIWIESAQQVGLEVSTPDPGSPDGPAVDSG